MEIGEVADDLFFHFDFKLLIFPAHNLFNQTKQLGIRILENERNSFLCTFGYLVDCALFVLLALHVELGYAGEILNTALVQF